MFVVGCSLLLVFVVVCCSLRVVLFVVVCYCFLFEVCNWFGVVVVWCLFVVCYVLYA